MSTVDVQGFRERMASGEPVRAGDAVVEQLHALTQEALLLCSEINGTYREPSELRVLLTLLFGRRVPDSVRLFPPFFTDCGKNTEIGSDVVINSGCRFQDQGGLRIGDGVLIGHNVVITTLDHDLDPNRRADVIPAPVELEEKVFVGANATILGGVRIGYGAVVGAGAVVTKDVPPLAVVVGSPARVIRRL
ncbi:MAG: DapH/DapD/GlmU-related protein [Propionibacteriaceae bacterium]|nr:DapH/DapD/GlmU-related protein [Propionibacteriaceae bacterium]